MYYKIVGQGWQYYSPSKKPPLFHLGKMTVEEYRQHLQNKK